MSLNIKISLPDKDSDNAVEEDGTPEPEVCVSEGLSSVSKSHMEALVRKVAEILDSQGVSCFRCPKVKYKLYSLSDDWEGKYLCRPHGASDRHIGMEVCCGNGGQVYTFELTLSPAGGKEMEE